MKYKSVFGVSLFITALLSACGNVESPTPKLQSNELSTSAYQAIAYGKLSKIINNDRMSKQSVGRFIITEPIYNAYGKKVAMLHVVTSSKVSDKSVFTMNVSNVLGVSITGIKMENPLVGMMAEGDYILKLQELSRSLNKPKLYTVTGSEIFISSNRQSFIGEDGQRFNLNHLIDSYKVVLESHKKNKKELEIQWRIYEDNLDRINSTSDKLTSDGNLDIVKAEKFGRVKFDGNSMKPQYTYVYRNVCNYFLWVTNCYSDQAGYLDNHSSETDGIGGGYYQQPFLFGHSVPGNVWQSNIAYTMPNVTGTGLYTYNLADENGGAVGCGPAAAGSILWWYWRRGNNFFGNQFIPGTGLTYSYNNASEQSKRRMFYPVGSNIINLHDKTSILYPLFAQTASGAPYLTNLMGGTVWTQLGGKAEGTLVTGPGWVNGLNQFLAAQQANVPGAYAKSVYKQLYLNDYNQVGVSGSLYENMAYVIKEKLSVGEPVIAMYVDPNKSGSGLAQAHFSPIIDFYEAHDPSWYAVFVRTSDSNYKIPSKWIDLASSSFYIKGVSALYGLKR